MRGTSNVNMILLVFSIIVMIVFVVMVWAQLAGGEGVGTVASMQPFFHDGVTMGAVLMGATIVCFSFIGFDAVTMYVEEARTPKIVPRALILTVLLGGAIFLIAGYFTQLRFPDWNTFAPGGDMQFIEDSTLPLIGEAVGGKTLMAVLTAAGFCATLASGLASHASVSVSYTHLDVYKRQALTRQTGGKTSLSPFSRGERMLRVWSGWKYLPDPDPNV